MKLFLFRIGTVLLRLNPLTALLSRKHMDLNFDRSLKETSHAPHCTMQPEVPLSLLPDITPSLIDSLTQHGAVLQLPSRPHFQKTQIKANAISLVWKVHEQNTDVSSDRTLTYSLHCHADIPLKTKVRQNFKKRYVRGLVTPESGFEDMSELSSESKNTFPSLPPSLLGSRNISLVRLQGKSSNQNGPSESHVVDKDTESQEQSNNNLVLKPTPGNNIASLLPEPIRLPKPSTAATSVKLLQLSVNSPDTSINATDKNTRNSTKTNTSMADHATAVLNLPPLVITSKHSESDTELMSITTSGVFADSEDATSPCGDVDESSAGRMSTLGESGEIEMPKMSRTDSSSSFTDTSDELNENEYTNVGRFCHGYAFEEIYCGEKPTFHYSGLVPGASYYFRVRCHNAAGWGPWSDTVKCMTNS